MYNSSETNKYEMSTEKTGNREQNHANVKGRLDKEINKQTHWP